MGLIEEEQGTVMGTSRGEQTVGEGLIQEQQVDR